MCAASLPTRIMVAALLAFGPGSVYSEILRVGPGMPYSVPSEAAAVAEDGDTIEIAAGDYIGDVAVWSQNKLTLRGTGGVAHLQANGQSAQGKAIWVIRGVAVTIEYLEFSGARVRERNGAGIRHEGGDLTIRWSHFHDNENGILSGDGAGSIVIENSIFENNGHGDGQSHNIYIGRMDRLTVTASYLHHAVVGHNIKSRARETIVSYSRIEDGRDGTSSYLVDTPNGGRVILIGNILQQGPKAENGTLIAYNAESKERSVGELFLINNTLVNDRHAGLFLKISNPLAWVHVQNNIFIGKGEVADREIRKVSNLVAENEKSWFGPGKILRDRENGDYHLSEGSKAMDAGTSLESFDLGDFRPVLQYMPVAQASKRFVHRELDIGAFEAQSY